jgi:hypothetical protein
LFQAFIIASSLAAQGDAGKAGVRKSPAHQVAGLLKDAENTLSMERYIDDEN